VEPDVNTDLQTAQNFGLTEVQVNHANTQKKKKSYTLPREINYNTACPQYRKSPMLYELPCLLVSGTLATSGLHYL
jgi:hypothetical protein